MMKPLYNINWLTSISTTDSLILVLLMALLVILGISILILRVIKVLVSETLNPQPFLTKEEREQKRLEEKALKKSLKAGKPSIWSKIMGLRPISEEKELVMEHEFDGISELDNPTPAWFMVLFYITIVFGLVYLVNYHVMGWGKLQDEEYVMELKQAEEDKLAFLKKPGNAANAVNENNVKVSTDKSVLESGAGLFKTRCAPCHGEQGQGLVGPNLTDEYWLHGGDVKEVFKTIKYGVLDKGMVAWEKSLSASQIADVTNYVLSLQGSNPAGAKAPQGVKK